MPTGLRFPIMIVVSLVVFSAVLYAALYRRERISMVTVAWVAITVNVGGMIFARLGALLGLPIWIYYGLPAALTWFLPPVVFSMRRYEVLRYVPMALVAAPMIHAGFSYLLGWHEYMPFMRVPSVWDR